MVEGGGAWDGEDIWREGAASEGRDKSSIGAALLWRGGREGGKGGRGGREGGGRAKEKKSIGKGGRKRENPKKREGGRERGVYADEN